MEYFIRIKTNIGRLNAYISPVKLYLNVIVCWHELAYIAIVANINKLAQVI